MNEEELNKLYAGIFRLQDLGQFMRLTLITCFLLQTGCRVQSCVPLLWDNMKLLAEDSNYQSDRHPYLSILLTPGKH